MRTARHLAAPGLALGLALGSALAGHTARSAVAEGGCGLPVFQGEWTATDRRDERLAVAAGEVTVTAGPVVTRLALRPEKDIGERGLAEVAAEMRQAAAVHAAALAALGAAETRVCVLRVATPGGSLALLAAGDGLLRLEEARSDPPLAQRLRRPEDLPPAPPAPDYDQPPR